MYQIPLGKQPFRPGKTSTLISCLTLLLSTTPATAVNPETVETQDPNAPDVRMIVVYDNNPSAEGLQTAWGFGCVVETGDHRLLFDTGGDGEILLSNMQRLGISPETIDAVMISHVHGDHLGGLETLLRHHAELPVFIPESFPGRVSRSIESAGATPVRVSGPLDILPGIMSTGVLSNGIHEQAAVIQSPSGRVIITGCAHPGIVNMVRETCEHLRTGQIHLILGGFHLRSASRRRIKRIIAQLEELGVQRAAPCHCSGENARTLFREFYGEKYIQTGVGSIIQIRQNTNGGE